MNFTDYYMNICQAIKLKSKDPKTKVGVVIVSKKNNKIISTGYNGPPKSFDDKIIDWKDRLYVHSIIIHAEANALLYGNLNLEECILYTTLSPCTDCIKLISACNIKEIIYEKEYKDFDKVRELCKLFKIKISKYINISN